MLSHRSLSPIWFLAGGYRTDILSLYFIRTPPYSLLFLLSRIFFFSLQILNQLGEILFFFDCGFQLCLEYSICKVKFFCLFLIEKCCFLHIACEFLDGNGLVLCELMIVPVRVAFEMILLSFEQTFFNILPSDVFHQNFFILYYYRVQLFFSLNTMINDRHYLMILAYVSIFLYINLLQTKIISFKQVDYNYFVIGSNFKWFLAMVKLLQERRGLNFSIHFLSSVILISINALVMQNSFRWHQIFIQVASLSKMELSVMKIFISYVH
jgi:hypothetical protein